jgi:hypothetical protein
MGSSFLPLLLVTDYEGRRQANLSKTIVHGSFARIDIFFEAQLCIGIRVAVVDHAERDTGKALFDKVIVASSYDTTPDATRPQPIQRNVAVPEAAMILVWTAGAAGKCIKCVLASR